MLSAWLAGRKLKPRTRLLYQAILDRDILPTLDEVPIDAITKVAGLPVSPDSST